MGKIQAKSIFRLVPLIGDLGRFLQALTLKIPKISKKCIFCQKAPGANGLTKQNTLYKS